MAADVVGPRCPDYRLRLFLSVDLAGSTQFKAGEGKKPVAGYEPLWAKVTREFYLDFPKLVEMGYSLDVAKLQDTVFTDRFPRVWKTLGDEIIFCCRVFSQTHVAVCVSAFLYAIKEFGARLDNDGGHLDLKSSAWLADFPAPNITVSKKFRKDRLDEEFEADADKYPDKVDFLGNGIDCGFRISRFAATDKCALSLDIAFIIASQPDSWGFANRLVYNDRHILKGVLKDRPYPIFVIDTERKPARKDVRDAEWALVGKEYIKPEKVVTFLRAFMKDEKIDPPVFLTVGLFTEQMPEPYRSFVRLWNEEDRVEVQRTNTEATAAQANGDGSATDLPDEVSRQIGELGASLVKARAANKE